LLKIPQNSLKFLKTNENLQKNSRKFVKLLKILGRFNSKTPEIFLKDPRILKNYGKLLPV
jgi:hypothetical protein